MPGVTDTEFFARADLVVAGFKNKLQVAMAGITPKEVLAEQHRKMAQPGTAKN